MRSRGVNKVAAVIAIMARQCYIAKHHSIGNSGLGSKVEVVKCGTRAQARKRRSERSPRPFANHRRMLYFDRNRALGPVFPSAAAVPLIAPVRSCRGVAQPGRAPGSGPGGRRFKSSLPDQILAIFRGYQAGCPTLFAHFAKGWGTYRYMRDQIAVKADSQSHASQKARRMGHPAVELPHSSQRRA